MFAFASAFTPSVHMRAPRAVCTRPSRASPTPRMALDDSAGAFPADACDLTGVCDPQAPPGAEAKASHKNVEAKVMKVDGVVQLQDYRGKESVLKDDSIRA